MRKVIITLFFLFLGFAINAQSHIEYVSEKTDSMALISKEDIDVINNVFEEKNRLERLHDINEEIISTLEINSNVQNSVIEYQELVIANDKAMIKELENRNIKNVEKYSKELKKEKTKKISFEALTGAGIIAIILLILL